MHFLFALSGAVIGGILFDGPDSPLGFLFGGVIGFGLSLLLQSFGFKFGAPRDADMMFDVRCLPNPYWEIGLRGLSGRDKAVIEFLQRNSEVQAMSSDLKQFLERWIPCFARENRAYLSIAIGCTGGHHRSVFIIDQLAEHFVANYPGLIVRHRELED